VFHVFFKTPSPLSPPASLVSVPYRAAPSPSDAAPFQRRSLLLPATPALPTPRPPPHSTAAPPHSSLQRRRRPLLRAPCNATASRPDGEAAWAPLWWRGRGSTSARRHWHKTCRKGTAWDLALAVLLSYVVMAEMGLNYCNGWNGNAASYVMQLPEMMFVLCNWVWIAEILQIWLLWLQKKNYVQCLDHETLKNCNRRAVGIKHYKT
jgi:hypothetical protein